MSRGLPDRTARFGMAACAVALASGCTTGGASGPTPDVDFAGTTTQAVVTHVIDGDTVDLSTGDRVRLIGIDTPEREQCGYAEATAETARMLEGEAVVVGNPYSVQDRDAYGRLLAYLGVPGELEDIGLHLVAAGLAIPRYDSTDGYDPHPREAEYAAAAAAAPSNGCGGAG